MSNYFISNNNFISLLVFYISVLSRIINFAQIRSAKLFDKKICNFAALSADLHRQWTSDKSTSKRLHIKSYEI